MTDDNKVEDKEIEINERRHKMLQDIENGNPPPELSEGTLKLLNDEKERLDKVIAEAIESSEKMAQESVEKFRQKFANECAKIEQQQKDALEKTMASNDEKLEKFMQAVCSELDNLENEHSKTIQAITEMNESNELVVSEIKRLSEKLDELDVSSEKLKLQTEKNLEDAALKTEEALARAASEAKQVVSN